jgi:hypothetical protein
MATFFLLVGLGFVVLGPVLVGLMFYFTFKIGRAVANKNPELWDSMRPGFYTDIRISREHRQRFVAFITDREYRSLECLAIDRLVPWYRLIRRCAFVSVIVGPISVVLGLALL